VKSDGDFEDILGEETPAVWKSNRPVQGGEAGSMLAKIIERAAKLKRATPETPRSRAPRAAKTSGAKKTAKTTKKPRRG
jgi:hypothetical protein